MAMVSSTSTCRSCAFGLRWHLADCQQSGECCTNRLETNLEDASKILKVCAWLHIFEVTEDQEGGCTPGADGEEVTVPGDENFGVNALEDLEAGVNGFLPTVPGPLDRSLQQGIPGISAMHQLIRDGVVQKGDQRPAHSTKRSGTAVN